MKNSKKYDTAGLVEDQYEPGSGGRVLKNLMRINRKREIDRVEAREQYRTINEIAKLFDEDHRFTAVDICEIHKIWLSRIYPWAGEYRQVNIGKGGFSFAGAQQHSFIDGRIRERPSEKIYSLPFQGNGTNRGSSRSRSH